MAHLDYSRDTARPARSAVGVRLLFAAVLALVAVAIFAFVFLVVTQRLRLGSTSAAPRVPGTAASLPSSAYTREEYTAVALGALVGLIPALVAIRLLLRARELGRVPVDESKPMGPLPDFLRRPGG
jgi:hypothetical protein